MASLRPAACFSAITLLAAIVPAGCSPGTGSGSGSPGAGSGGVPGTGATAGAGAGAGGSAAGGAGAGGGRSDAGPFITVPDASEPPPDAPLSVDSGCEGVKDARPQAPNVLIVLDRSRSMYLPPDVDRWNPAVAAITQLTQSLENQVRFGLMEFPSPFVTTSQAICASGELIVPPDLKTAGAIASALAGDPTTKVGGSTPTALALAAARDVLASNPETSYVLLVTDGAPNCNATLDSQTCTCTSPRANECTGAAVDGGLPTRKTPELCLDDDAAVAAVEQLTTAGIRTFVVGYDTTTFASTLDRMAAAGATLRTTYFPVSDGASLTAAFQDISAYVVSCTFELAAAPRDASYVSVSIDGLRVKRGVGWQLQGDRVVQLIGDSCKTVSDGSHHDIIIVRECAPVVQ